MDAGDERACITGAPATMGMAREFGRADIPRERRGRDGERSAARSADERTADENYQRNARPTFVRQKSTLFNRKFPLLSSPLVFTLPLASFASLLPMPRK
jgi:hypothetical protein